MIDEPTTTGDQRPRRGGPQRIPRPPGTRRGSPPPWHDLDDHGRRLQLDQVRDALIRAPAPKRSPIELVTSRAAAVLAPLYEHEGETWVVLTRRAWHLRSHTGEVAFPGGRFEPHDESLWHTALREAEEEVGLDPGLVEPVGELDHLTTITSRGHIVPYVGVLSERPELVPEPGEVDAVLHVPLSELLLPDVYRQERWGLPGVDRPIHFFELYGDTVWGATGSMLVDLLAKVTGPRR